MGDILTRTIGAVIIVIQWDINAYIISKSILRLNMRRKVWLRIIIFIIVYSAILIPISLYTPYWQNEYISTEMTIVHHLIDRVLMYFMVIVCTFLTIKEKWYYTALYSLASFSMYAMLISIWSYFLEELLLIIFKDMLLIFYISIIISPISFLIISLIIARKYKIKNKMLFFKMSKKEHIYIYLLILMNFYLFSGILTINAESDDFSLVEIIAFSAIVLQILALIYLINARIILKERHSLNQNYLKLQEEHYQSIMEKDFKLRKLRHDMKHHLYMLRMLNEEGEREEMSSYLKSIGDTLDREVELS